MEEVIDVDDPIPSSSNSNANQRTNAAANSQESNELDLPPIGSGKLVSNVSWAYSLNYFRKCDDETSICRLCEQEKKKNRPSLQINFKTTNFQASHSRSF